MRAESGGWGMGGPAFSPQWLRRLVVQGRRPTPEMPGVAAKVCLSRAASGQGTRDHAVQQ
jgi:hypothetical protein